MSATDVQPTLRIKATLRNIMRRLLPRPSPDIDALQATAIRQSDMFDPKWYLGRYPDVAGMGLDPALHYVRHGAAEGRNPSAAFETMFYLERNPDVATAGMNPLWHYLEFGRKEQRAVRPQTGQVADAAIRTGGSVSSKATAISIIAGSGMFDRDYYFASYPAVAAAGMDPIAHYVRYGAMEGRNPCLLFDTRYYLKNNPDVVAAGINPLVHFYKYGRHELRNPSADFDMAWWWVTHLDDETVGHSSAYILARSMLTETDVRAVGKLSEDDKKQAVSICMKALDRDDLDTKTVARLGAALARWSCWAAAERMLNKALSADWNNPKGHARLADVLRRQAKWWQSVESWQTATALAPDAPAGWWFRLGEAQEKMNRFPESAHAYQQALALNPTNANWQYLLGYVAGKAGQAAVSIAAYTEAVRLDERPEIKAFGVGAFHQARGYWPEAAIAYQEELRENPLSADLHFRLGMAYDRVYRWQNALASYSRAISLDLKSKPQWHYRYGFVLERLKRWVDAAQAYAAAASLSAKDMPYWRYRQGYALAAAGGYEQACAAYIAMRLDRTVVDATQLTAADVSHSPGVKSDSADRGSHLGAPDDVVTRALQDTTVDSYFAGFDEAVVLIRRALKHDFTQADLYYKLGECLERQEDWQGSVDAYANALARSNLHRPEWFYRHGYALFRIGRFEEACNAFRQTHIIQRPYGISQGELKNGSAMLRLSTHYAEYLETLPVNEKVIFYDSHLGKFASCNPLAMFNYLVVHPLYKDFMHVWAIDEADRVPDAVRRMTNVAIVQRHTDLFLRYLVTAKYLISNSILPQYFVRRPGQKCLATWHGTPLKTLGKQQQYKFQEHKRTQRFFLQSTHIISPNPHTTNVLLDSYDLRHIMTGKIAETGYPRIDLTLNANEQRRDELRGQLGVSGRRPVVLYAPTWRGTLETVSYEVERAKSDLAYLAEQHDCDVIFRGHHLMEKMFGTGDSLGCTVAPAIIDTNELLSVVDVLITDYSSIFFDFLATGRPVLYYVYDQEEYQRDRGLYFSMDDMPGYKCPNIESLSQSLGLALRGNVPDVRQQDDARQKFNCHDDGMATKRAVEFLFDDDVSHVIDAGPRAKINLLMQGGGFKRNGITTSFLNLLKYVDRSIVHVTVAVSPEAIELDPECLELFSRVPEDVAVVARHGLMTMTWEERWLRKHYERSRHELNDEQMAIIRHLFDREFQRVFGDVHFDVAVSFSGYDALWGSIFNLSEHNVRKVIYMHNDMRDEYTKKFPELMRMFRLYKSADRLVCVCDESKSVNRDNLSSWLGIPKDRFITSENVQDPERIIEYSCADIEAQDECLFNGGPVFVNMGRLSVEKGQGKLILAFAKLCAEQGPMQLLILGVGPLRASLRNLIEELGMESHIHLLGLRSNPYPYLKRADCFVLSSNHEAKCMSLMEAIIIGTPCVATDISGNRDIKKDFPQYFFENSEEGLYKGMRKYLASELPLPTFDCKKYQNEALAQFETRVLNVQKPSKPSGQLFRNNPVLRSNRVVVAARVDGLGERLNALLNGMYLAERLGFDFAYLWSEKSSWERMGADGAHHAIEPESEIFSANFIARYSLENLDRKGLIEVSGKGVSAEDFSKPILSTDFKGWLAPRLDLTGILAPELAPDESLNLRDIFSKVEFSPAITGAVDAAKAVILPANCVAIHLRSGDIFYGPYRKLVLYSYKGITLPIAKAIVHELKNEGENAILFGQDREVMRYIKQETGVYVLEDLTSESFDSPAAQAIFELVLMSRCKYIIAGSSGFAKQASWIGGLVVKQPKDMFGHLEQTRITMDDLSKHADEYHPLQAAFAYWYAYYHGRQFKSAELVEELLEKAAAYDPENQLYPMKRAFNFYRMGRFQDGEAVLRELIAGEFATRGTDELPVFGLLTAKTLAKFNLAEDFEAISTAAKSGAPFAAACSYLIARAKKENETDALEIFSACRGSDPILASLYDAWSSQ